MVSLSNHRPFTLNVHRIGIRANVRLTEITAVATLAPFPATIGSAIASGGNMYVIVAPIQIKEGNKEEFIKAMLEDATGLCYQD